MPFRAFLDANVLVPARLRDVLLTLAEVRLYEVRWSAEVLAEAARHLPESMDAADRAVLFSAMAQAFPDALVEWPDGFEADVPKLVNQKDRHVVAAAVFAHAEVLVTSDRPLIQELEQVPGLIEAQTASAFVAYTLDSDLSRAGAALLAMARRRWLPGASAGSNVEIRDRLGIWARRELGDAVGDLIARPEFLRRVE
ncbi:PIN domain-containing protein [Nocardia sp. XZ_19_385]|uniref:PIN domain-containing protein n=1 Tax=Nocardia sp. XZ_19_385 TaxID=2769488 RepID=UPI00188E3CEC|nr:PIN domain-containing protein [Nocardia sp. XZ_19_385]